MDLLSVKYKWVPPSSILAVVIVPKALIALASVKYKLEVPSQRLSVVIL